LRPEINFRAESSSLLKQASASSRAIYRSAAESRVVFQKNAGIVGKFPIAPRNKFQG